MMSWVTTANVGRYGLPSALRLLHHLAVDLEDQLAEQRGANRIETGVGLVEQQDVRAEHERPREAGALAHTAGELVGEACRGSCRGRPP